MLRFNNFNERWSTATYLLWHFTIVFCCLELSDYYFRWQPLRSSASHHVNLCCGSNWNPQCLLMVFQTWLWWTSKQTIYMQLLFLYRGKGWRIEIVTQPSKRHSCWWIKGYFLSFMEIFCCTPKMPIFPVVATFVTNFFLCNSFSNAFCSLCIKKWLNFVILIKLQMQPNRASFFFMATV